MEFIPQNVQLNAMGAGVCKLTLQGKGSDKVVLDLTSTQVQLLNSRFIRSFMIRCKKEKILFEIDNASNCDELEALARKYSLCDACELSDINIYGVRRILKVIVDALYRYPRLRSRFCYIGSHAGYRTKLEKLKMGDESVLKEFALHYICDRKTAMALGKLACKVMDSFMLDHEAYIATATSVFGLFDAVLLDPHDYEGYAYIKLVSDLRNSERTGFHPKACHSPESVVYHEIGHMIDYLCSLSANGSFLSYVLALSAEEISKGVSRYATTSTQELIAEAFAEYMCNPSPREIARYVGKFIDEEYAKIPK